MVKAILSIVIVVGLVGAVLFFKNKDAVAPENGSQQTFCTQDVKKCSDGSYVSRQGANCEFAPCPTGSPFVSRSTSPAISPTASPTVTVTPQSQTVTVTFAAGVATPSVVNIKVGSAVKFVNNDNVPHWPASGPHPTHTTCPGFNSLRGLNKGETYSFTFSVAKTCPWHDHLKPSIYGQIIVAP